MSVPPGQPPQGPPGQPPSPYDYPDHLPVWTQGDATDPRGQIYRMTKFDQGLTPAAGMPLIFKNPGYVFGRVATAGLADLAVTLAKMAPNSVDSSKIVDGSIVDADVAAAGTAEIDYRKFAQAPTGKWQGTNAAAIVTATPTNIVFATQAITNTAYYDLSATDRITLVTAGTYLIAAEILWPAPAAPAGHRQAQLLLSGGAVALNLIPAVLTANTSTAQGVVTIQRISATSFVQLQATHTQGANLTVANDVRTFLAMTYLGHL